MASRQGACDSEGFRMASGRRRVRASRSANRPPAPSSCDYSGPAGPQLLAAVGRSRSRLSSPFVEQVSGMLQDSSLEFQAVVCYGIGRIGTCEVARQQLALLLHITDTIAAQTGDLRMYIYDPVLSSTEETALEELGFTYIHHNELCRRRAEVPMLFYMPHCGRAMYNNLLWANWSPQLLAKMALIGNSFHSYIERTTEKQLQTQAPYIHSLLPYCQEQPFPPYPDPTVFNDFSLHSFPLEVLHTVPASTWTKQTPPPIDPSDPEMIV